MRNLLKKKWVKNTLIAFGGIIVIWYLVSNGTKPNNNPLITVKKGNLMQEVTVTGRVQPTDEVSLAFERSGKVSDIYKKVGDEVKAREVIITLSADDIYAQVDQASAGVEVAKAQLLQYQAVLDSQKAKLSQLQAGTRTEEIKIAETAVDNANKALTDVQAKAAVDIANKYDGTSDVLNDAYAKSDDAVRIKASGYLGGDLSNGYKINFNTCDAQGVSDVETMRKNLEGVLIAWKADITGVSDVTDQAVLDTKIKTAKDNLALVKKFIDRSNDILTIPCLINDSSQTTNRTNVTTARINIIAALSSVNVLQQSIASQKSINDSAINAAQNVLASVQDQLSLKKAGATAGDIAIQQALVKQADANVQAQRGQIRSAEANLANFEAQAAKTIIRSPIDGVVTRQDGKVGEIAPINTPIVSVISFAKFEIETSIPEVDIGKLALGNIVIITLDALPDSTFQGKVVQIDPAETIVDGVVNFKVKVEFDKTDERFKSGLTANLSIQTANKENVLILPQYAIIENDKGTFIRKVIKGVTKEVEVKTGIRSQNGDVEILSGIDEGDTVMNIGSKTSK